MAQGRGRTSSHGRSHSGGQSRFASIPSANIQRSKFNRSNGLKTAFNAGDLIPIFVDEALPGDTFSMKANSFGRLATPINPVMDNLYVDYFFFAVPNRLLWENWEKFNGEETDPGDSTDFTIPQTPVTGNFPEFSLADYFGLPVGIDIQVSALWFRAYNLIWNEWFRDENLQDSLPVPMDDGPDALSNYSIVRRGKRHDYFTSCLPWPQKGDPVSLPLTGNAPVVGTGDSTPSFDGGGRTGLNIGMSDGETDARWSGGATPNATTAATWNDTKLVADLSAVTAATINDLREAFQLQRMFERDARGGTRYTEILRSHFGVVSPDQRLQRPEFLGGGRSVVNINPIAQTSQTEPPGSGTAQGNLAAFGVTQGIDIGFTKSFVEHCVILGFCSLRADLNYQDGVERMWSRKSRFDFYWPTLAHLGEQAVLNKEIFHQGTAADDLVFGYQERYAEYRYKPSRVTSRMRSKSAAPLDTWHLAQDFSALPVLNASFIEEDPPVSRISAVVVEPHLLLDMFFDYQCARPMPTYSVPGLIDHF